MFGNLMERYGTHELRWDLYNQQHHNYEPTKTYMIRIKPCSDICTSDEKTVYTTRAFSVLHARLKAIVHYQYLVYNAHMKVTRIKNQ